MRWCHLHLDFLVIAVRTNLSWTSSSLGLRTSALEGKKIVSLVIGVESESLYSKSTHFDSALAADLHEKSLGIFSSHAGAIAGAGHLWEHKPNLKQDELKQYLKCRTIIPDHLQEIWQPCYASQNLGGICVWHFFFCKYLGVAFIQKPSHSNPHNPVLNLKLLGTSALEIRNLHCWWLLSSQNHSIPNPLTLTQPWQQTYMRNH